MPKPRIILVILVFTLILGQTSQITAQKKFALTIDNIMRGPELYGYEPTAPRWSEDGQRVYFQWKQANEPRIKPDDTYVVNRDGSGLRKLSDEETKNLPPRSAVAPGIVNGIAYAENGDIFVYDFSLGPNGRSPRPRIPRPIRNSRTTKNASPFCAAEIFMRCRSTPDCWKS